MDNLNLYSEDERVATLHLVENKLLAGHDAASMRCDEVFHDAIMRCENASQSTILASLARQFAILAFAWQPKDKSYDDTIRLMTMFLSAGIQEAIQTHRFEEAAG